MISQVGSKILIQFLTVLFLYLKSAIIDFFEDYNGNSIIFIILTIIVLASFLSLTDKNLLEWDKKENTTSGTVKEKFRSADGETNFLIVIDKKGIFNKIKVSEDDYQKFKEDSSITSVPNTMSGWIMSLLVLTFFAAIQPVVVITMFVFRLFKYKEKYIRDVRSHRNV